jgi:Ala-tRNA(Pro) deacylase
MLTPPCGGGRPALWRNWPGNASPCVAAAKAALSAYIHGLHHTLTRVNWTDDERMPATRQQLFSALADLGIETKTIDHPAVFTVAESDNVEISLPGAHTKNLFLKDDKGALFLVIANSGTRVDLKSLSKKLGTGRFSFGKPELLLDTLGVTPGSVTAFAAINDTTNRVKIIVDEALMVDGSINCHPLENTATTNIARDDLLRFIRATGHEPRVMVLSAS